VSRNLKPVKVNRVECFEMTSTLSRNLKQLKVTRVAETSKTIKFINACEDTFNCFEMISTVSSNPKQLKLNRVALISLG
jgi:hypothetical protein